MVQRVNEPPNSDGKVSVAWLKGPGADGLYRRSTEVGVCGPAAGHRLRATRLAVHNLGGTCAVCIAGMQQHGLAQNICSRNGMQCWVACLSL